MRKAWSVRKNSPWSANASRRHAHPFGTISVVLLRDFKQLPSVCDSPLFKANGINPSGYNKYQLFDKSITFTEIMRQPGADQADIRAQLTRMGEVCLRKKTGEAGWIETPIYLRDREGNLPGHYHPCMCEEKIHDLA